VEYDHIDERGQGSSSRHPPGVISGQRGYALDPFFDE
jgi:alpha-beta hydrolase superfamily lysophospholipase